MSETAGLPPAGWYPDPELSGSHRWWSGREWGDLGPPPGSMGPAGASVWVLGRILGILLGLFLVVSVALLCLYVWGGTSVAADLERGVISTGADFDSYQRALWHVSLPLTVVAGVCWMIWQYRLARSLPRAWLQRSPGWHAFSWLIPLANLVLPFQNVKNLCTLLLRAPSGRLLGVWWTTVVASVVLTRISTAVESSVDDVGSFRAAMTVDAVLAAVWIVSALTAIRIVGRLTSARQDRVG